MRWSEERRARENTRRMIRKDALLAAFMAGWDGACQMHLYGSKVGSPDRFDVFKAIYDKAIESRLK